MTRKVFHVVPHGALWQVEYNRQILTKHYLKHQAVEEARSYALANQPSQVLIHNHLGKIETEWTYENDPFPPKG